MDWVPGRTMTTLAGQTVCPGMVGLMGLMPGYNGVCSLQMDGVLGSCSAHRGTGFVLMLMEAMELMEMALGMKTEMELKLMWVMVELMLFLLVMMEKWR